jgi:pyruvate kinase
VVEQMSSIALAAEQSYTGGGLDTDFLNQTFLRVDQSIAYGALFTASHLRVKAICALTDSGSTALWMSRHDIDIPIFALTPRESTHRKLSLYRNVRAELVEVATDRDSALIAAETLLIELGVVQPGDLVCMTIGEPMGSPGGTNTLKIIRVGETLRSS